MRTHRSMFRLTPAERLLLGLARQQQNERFDGPAKQIPIATPTAPTEVKIRKTRKGARRTRQSRLVTFDDHGR